jgi:curli biogenesis system outer membrane secretion channel CsgG
MHPHPDDRPRARRARHLLLDRVLPALPAILLLLIFAAAAARAQDSARAIPPTATPRLTLVVMPFDAPMGSLDRGKRLSIDAVVPMLPLLLPARGVAMPASHFTAPAPAPHAPSTLPQMQSLERPVPRSGDVAGHAHAASDRDDRERTAASTDMGVAIANLLVARLVADGRFRVLDAAQLAAIRRDREECEARPRGPRCRERSDGARAPAAGELYLVTGAIVRVGPQERTAVAGGGRFSLLGVLGFKRKRMEMTVVARVVDAATGEVIASATTSGRSDAKGSVGGGAVAGGAIAGVGVSEQGGGPTEQAMARAVDALASELAGMATARAAR